MIEGRHEDVRDRDNFTKMYFVRKYQLPTDVDPADIGSSIDGRVCNTIYFSKTTIISSHHSNDVHFLRDRATGGTSPWGVPSGKLTDFMEKKELSDLRK